MKLIRIVLLVFVLSFLLNGISFANEAEVLEKNGFAKNDGSNVRAGDNVNFEILCELGKDEPIKVIGERYSWFKILLPKKAHIYIKNDYVDLSLENRETGTVNAIRVNLRAGPDTKYSILGQVSKPKELRIISEENGWYKIEPPNGVAGWIHSNQVTFSSESIAMETEASVEESKEEVVQEGIPVVEEGLRVELILDAPEPKGNLTFSSEGE